MALREVAKLKYQLKQLRDAVDLGNHPMAGTIIDYDLGEDEVKAIHDAFEKIQEVIEAGGDPSWAGFEAGIQANAGLGYQALKMVTINLHKEGYWEAACEAYAANHGCSEFDNYFGRKKQG